MKPVAVVLLICCATTLGCRLGPAQPERRPLVWSGWIEEAAAKRGHVKPGDIAQFGCPPGWFGVEDTAAALRGKESSAVYVGTDPPTREGTVTCVAQAEFDLPPARTPAASVEQGPRRPLAPVWVEVGPDSTTIGFRSEVSPGAAIYFARDTPCGPRIIGVRLRDLLTWLVDPQAATRREFLGMVSAGCPEQNGAR